MKKYFAVFLIPCLLLYLTGCYSMQEVGKDDLTSKKSHELCLWIKDKEFKFDENSYSIANDTIQGKGKYAYIGKDKSWVPFDGKIALKDARDIEIDKLNVFVFVLLTCTISAVCIAGMLLAGDLSSPRFN